MRRYVVTTQFLMVPIGGRIELDADQARARRYALRHVCGDIFEVIAQVGFKRGEVFGCEPAPHRAFVEEVKNDETVTSANDGSLEAMDRKALVKLAADIGLTLSQYRLRQTIIDEIREWKRAASGK